ncbi:MAG: alpha-1,2-fucosyltransferase [Eubacteriales bacterium]|nr:alpha-1,2-fucosyltransferase [Eubacteriales bacterium]
MRLIHTDSGLGNQMLDYAEYLAIRQSNPDGNYYLEDLIYDLPDNRPGMFSQWNGYELDRIFHLHMPKLRDLMIPSDRKYVVSQLEKSRFWENDWNYADPLCQALQTVGYPIRNFNAGRHGTDLIGVNSNGSAPRRVISAFFRTMPGYHIKRILKHTLTEQLVARENAKFDPFQKYPDDVLIGHSLAFCRKGFGIEHIDAQLREAFRFPAPEDDKNQRALDEISDVNAVAIHARRSDMLFVNGYCYRYGYFKRAVRYVKKHSSDPVFYFFTDEKSVDWCKENEQIFGLDFAKDRVRFIDWNKGENSFRDMQLMAACHHNIFTESSFGFWGAYLNPHPDKITCAPDPTLLATHDF